MSKMKLSPRQKQIIEDVFSGMDEESLAKIYDIKISVLRQWLGEDRFKKRLNEKIESAQRQSSMIIASCGPVAAARLVGLMDSDKSETARKACLDIISVNRGLGISEKAGGGFGAALGSEVADKILEILSVKGKKGKKCV